MKRNFKKWLLQAGVTALLGMSVNLANAALVIDSWNLTNDSLSFNLIGTVDAVGAFDTDSFFIGPADSINVDWINFGLTGGTLTQNGGDYWVGNTGAYDTPLYGTYVYSNGAPIYVGMAVDISFNYALQGLFNASALDGLDIYVAAGYNNYPSLPDLSVADVALPGVVPEPGTISLFGLGLLGLGFIRRRTR